MNLNIVPVDSSWGRLQELCKVVSFALEVSPENIRRGLESSPKVTEGRVIVMALAHKNRVIDDGRMQDFLSCSQKSINEAQKCLAQDAKMTKLAETIWSVYSSVRITHANVAKRRPVTMSSLTQTVPLLIRASWEDVKMYPERWDCYTAMQTVVLIGRDVLRKEFEPMSRVLARSPAEVGTLYNEGHKTLQGIANGEEPEERHLISRLLKDSCNQLELTAAAVWTKTPKVPEPSKAPAKSHMRAKQAAE